MARAWLSCGPVTSFRHQAHGIYPQLIRARWASTFQLLLTRSKLAASVITDLPLHKFDRKLDREFSLFERDAIGVLLSLRSKIEGTGLQFVEITSQHGHQGLMWRR